MAREAAYKTAYEFGSAPKAQVPVPRISPEPPREFGSVARPQVPEPRSTPELPREADACGLAAASLINALRLSAAGADAPPPAPRAAGGAGDRPVSTFTLTNFYGRLVGDGFPVLKHGEVADHHRLSSASVIDTSLGQTTRST